MCAFAGFVDYGANFLKTISHTTKLLWDMAGLLGAGAWHGIDIVEECGAFVQNSHVPLTGKDYCSKDAEGVMYLLHKGRAAFPLCGAVFIPHKKTLTLFREKNGSPVYYEKIDGLFVFGTSKKIFTLFNHSKTPKTLPPGTLTHS